MSGEEQTHTNVRNSYHDPDAGLLENKWRERSNDSRDCVHNGEGHCPRFGASESRERQKGSSTKTTGETEKGESFHDGFRDFRGLSGEEAAHGGGSEG